MPSSRGSSPPRDRTQVSCIASRFFTIWATKGALSDPYHKTDCDSLRTDVFWFASESIIILSRQLFSVPQNTFLVTWSHDSWIAAVFLKKSIYFFVFGCPGSSLAAWAFSGCRGWGPVSSCDARASYCSGFSHWATQAPGQAGFSNCSTWAQ